MLGPRVDVDDCSQVCMVRDISDSSHPKGLSHALTVLPIRYKFVGPRVDVFDCAASQMYRKFTTCVDL